MPKQKQLPKTGKYYRCEVRLESGDGKWRWHPSELLTQDDANAALMEHQAYGREAHVVIDRDAVDAYYAAVKAKEDEKKSKRGSGW